MKTFLMKSITEENEKLGIKVIHTVNSEGYSSVSMVLTELKDSARSMSFTFSSDEQANTLIELLQKIMDTPCKVEDIK